MTTRLTCPECIQGNHYPAKDWDLFVCPEADNAPLYDGHTTQDVADRLRHYLTGGNS